MSGIVFVNDWNGFGGGIFASFEDALEDIAIIAVGDGVEGHEERLEAIEYLAKPLADLGFGGRRLEHNLYAIVSAEWRTFSIRTHDTGTRPGTESKTRLLVHNDMVYPAWAVQKALYDFSQENYVNGETIREEMVSTLENQILKIRQNSKSPEEALEKVVGIGIPNLAPKIHGLLFAGDISDPEAFLEDLPERAGTLFMGILGKAYGRVAGNSVQMP